MPFGLPLHLAESTFVRAVTRASHAAAGVCLAVAALILGILQLSGIGLILWPAMLALIPMMVLLVLLERRPTPLAAGAYLVIGAACVYWFALTVTAQYAMVATSDAFLLALPKMALILVAAPAPRIRLRLLWCVAGYVAGEAATLAAVAQTPATAQVDVSVLILFAVTLALIAASAANRRSTRLARPTLHLAARDEQLSRLRTRIETQAAALVHDTVLNSLAAVAASAPGRVSAGLRTQLQRDLELLIGGDWLRELGEDPADPATDGEQQRRLSAAIDDCRRLGLDVETTGDIAAVRRLSVERGAALALAVKQCLVNVLKHAGTDRAQVAIYGTDTDVAVMVTDTGRGFLQDNTGGDRLGMRTSIHRRIEAVDGQVRVWSTPGRGTSVMMQVPAAHTTPQVNGR
ncbi:ATP-binding protein [Salinibacterium sp. ZJ454]|uniref:sensor histidine kinase n=1 Tax=Salinibacterium sp. ZJ454 TaxID=2708339 RepID=UPI00141F3E6D|nr:ATP-binding protein [Salinibacterium sp. ZJ454]